MAGRLSQLSDELGLFPGSIRPRVLHPNRLDPEPKPKPTPGDDWDVKPKIYVVGGQEREFFTVGMLAKALGRKPVTIRKWESEGIIPRSTFQAPSDDPRGRRRLYTREQVEGIVRIAEEEGILAADHSRSIKDTAFTEKVVALFKELQEAA